MIVKYSIILDSLLTYKRSMHEKELVCAVAQRDGLCFEDMMVVEGKLCKDLQDLCKQGYLQSLKVGWYALLPLPPDGFNVEMNEAEEMISKSTYAEIWHLAIEKAESKKTDKEKIKIKSKSMKNEKSRPKSRAEARKGIKIKSKVYKLENKLNKFRIRFKPISKIAAKMRQRRVVIQGSNQSSKELEGITQLLKEIQF